MYKYYNANSKGNHVNDCVIRALSVAENVSWDKMYEKLSDIAQEQGIILDDINFVERYLDERYPRACHYAETVEEFIEEHPKGIFLITMPGHITVVKNGYLIDTFNCEKRKMWCAWKVK